MSDFTDDSVSPTEDDLDVNSAASSTDSDVPADSSSETDTDETLLDAIEGALKSDDDPEPKDSGNPSEPKPEGDGEPGKPGTVEGKEVESEEPDDGKDVPEGQRVPFERFQTVIRQRDSMVAERDSRIQELQKSMSEYEVGHKQYEAITGFMETTGLSNEDVVRSLQIAALINSDPAEALRQLTPTVDALRISVGDKLPEDLQAKVDSGELDEAGAKEISKLRADNIRLQHRGQQVTEQQQQERQQNAMQQARTQMAVAATTVTKKLASSDPDFDAKRPMIEREVRLLISTERPTTGEAAANIVKRAHAKVTQELKALKLGTRQEIKPGPADSGASGKPAAREPATMLDAMQAALDNQE